MENRKLSDPDTYRQTTSNHIVHHKFYILLYNNIPTVQDQSLLETGKIVHVA